VGRRPSPRSPKQDLGTPAVALSDLYEVDRLPLSVMQQLL
jgi:hypothetical protein